MFYHASKILWVLTQPSNLIVGIIAAGVLALSLGRGKVARWLLYPGGAALLLISVLPVGLWLLAPLENRFPAPAEPPRDIDGIVVLGGGVDLEVSARRGVVALQDTSERFTSLVELARRNPDARVVSGGPSWLEASDISEATVLRDFLRDQGLDEARVIFEDRARNTHENALLAKARAAPEPRERWRRVTSASHMPRAVGCFRQVGWPLLAYPVDYRTTGELTLLRVLDAAQRWHEFDDAISAWIGLVAYWMTDRIPDLLPAP
jgi:uncharacterized SAM-binding protein YcdF (DUF218 family)